jgi:hypothetical protein
MEKHLLNVPEHMRRLGLAALAHANWHSNYISPDNAWWAELSVLQAAHAAEILIKARIAEEHPLLIFEHLPRPTSETTGGLSFDRLIESGRTVQFKDLPDRLWATTGLTIPNLDQFLRFGALRNSIQHFAVPDSVASLHTLHFIYRVIDPFINQCWGLFAVDFNEDHEPHQYLIEGLVRRGIPFLVSPESTKCLTFADIEWPEGHDAFKNEMLARFTAATAAKVGN